VAGLLRFWVREILMQSDLRPGDATTDDELLRARAAVEGKSAGEVLAWAAATFGESVTIASSFGVEDVALLGLAASHAPGLPVFTLDTGRLHAETYDVMERWFARRPLQVFAPERAAVETLERTKGFFSFRNSVDDRKECCALRKVEPLRRALQGKQAWITGLRRAQATTRTGLEVVERDAGNGGLLKISPLAAWSEDETWSYVKAHKLPYNALHDAGFPSIGCSPCTRAIAPGEDVRAGRWWWESADHKECGLHARRG